MSVTIATLIYHAFIFAFRVQRQIHHTAAAIVSIITSISMRVIAMIAGAAIRIAASRVTFIAQDLTIRAGGTI